MNQSAAGVDATGRPRLLRSLAHRNYRLFFFGQGTSMLGTWLQHVALSWLVYRLTESPWWLGVVNFCGQIPTLFLAPLVGVWAERTNRRQFLVITQSLAMIQALLLAVLTVSGTVTVPQLVVLSLWLGCVNACDIPTRMAFLPEIIQDRQHLGNAIALNSSLVNIARFLGPAVAGILITWFGEGACFVLNALSYLAVLAALLAMRLPPWQPAAGPRHLGREFREGVRYTYGTPRLRALLLLLMLISLVGAPYTTLLPLLATDVLGGTAETLGFLVSAAGCGALTAALYMALRQDVQGLRHRVALAPALLGVGLLGLSWAREMIAVLGLLFVAGFALMVQLTASNTVLQTEVAEDKRGRVMSFYTMSFMGTVPIGSLLAGGYAQRMGTSATLRLGGGLCLAAAGLFVLHLMLHPELDKA